ncbi:MAG: type III PLP-dependent enzyme [Candidatus Peribacteraceae bacterium]|nr:type III PLP-dependent enzyme [Candidatus Peribacteraceae bacterium]
MRPLEFEKIKKFALGKPTPFLILDLKKIAQNYDELAENFPTAKIFYALKANPNQQVLKTLAKKGSNFDAATIFEIKKLLGLGIPPERISFGNTIKKEIDIEFAYRKGVRIFVTDSVNDLQKIGRRAPGSKIFFRLITEGSGADWPLSRKFGAHPDMIYDLIVKAKKIGLTPFGISFHVGSQQRHIGQWDNSIAQVKYLFSIAKREGINLKAINLGGGFPTNYLQPTQKLKIYAREIKRFLKKNFGTKMPEIFVEPGRMIAGDAGVLVSEVITVARKSATSEIEWVFLDIGKFGGLIETTDEAIKYPIFAEKRLRNLQEVVLAGPTCDSVDVLYENFKYRLPANLREGDRIYFFSAGAYTTSYSAIEFNGIPPLQEYILPN